jgi:hypothetical protein
MERKMDECRRAALFAPDYDEKIDDEIVDLALARLTAADRMEILSYDPQGHARPGMNRLSARGLILHGLAEIFEQRLTPLGLAIRERIK